MNLSTSQKQILAAILVSIIVVLVGAIYYSLFVFHITKTSPNVGNYPSSLGTMDITFNQDLDTSYIQNNFDKDPQSVIQLSTGKALKLSVEQKTLKVTFRSTPKVGKYSLKLSDIKAANGSVVNTNLQLIINNINYKDMNKDDQKRFDEEATTGEEFPNDPIVGILPHETNDYKINYSFPPEEGTVPARIIITMKFFEPGDNALAATVSEKNEYLSNIRKYRGQALDYLRSKEVDLNKYIINYTEIDLRNEFPAGYIPQGQ